MTSAPPKTESLEDCIRSRHSIRFYKPDAVPEPTLHHCLKLAQLSPSNSNMQNWRLVLATGPARARIAAALAAAAAKGAPAIPPLPPGFAHFRSETGHVLYGGDGYGVSRADAAGHDAAVRRNFEFFGAPVVGIITMDDALETVDAMSVGFFVQAFMLALAEQGLGSCLLVSVTGYPDVLREGFEIGTDQRILCGIAVGYPADHRVNRLHIDREPLEHQTKILRE